MYTQSILAKSTTYSALALGLVLALFLLSGFAQVASAHEDPVDCNASGLQQFPSVGPAGNVYDGDELTYAVIYANIDPDGAGAVAPCNITGADASITLPDGSVVNVLTDATLSIGDSISCPGDAECAAGPYTYTVDHADESGSNSVTAEFDINGILHQDADEEAASDFDTLSKTVVHPSTEADASVDVDVIVNGDEVILTITETNDGDVNLTNPFVEVDNGIGVLDETSPEFVGGDTGGDGILGQGEVWEWEVTVTPASDTTYTVIGHGTDPNGNDVTWTEGCEVQDPEENIICDIDELATVDVSVVQGLEVEKTVNESFDRAWTWDIVKSADQTDLLLQEGQIFTVNYDVDVSAVSADVNHEVTGTITVTNPVGNPDATVTDVSDVLDVSGAATVSCEDEDSDTTAPWTLSGGEVLTCTYEQLSADPDDSENVATVTTEGDVPGGSDTQPVSFDEDDLDEETDECVDVSDTNVGPLGTVCADAAPETFEYSLDFSTDAEADVVLECGLNEHPNVADLVTNDTQTTDEDDETVLAEVECVVGCTLTQGYWKTHSEQGPAPYDSEGWGALGDFDGDGPEEQEMEDWPWGIDWFTAFWTPPKGGNVWYKLAHQFQAAYLNVANGAGAPTEVTDALADAEVWLLANDPAAKLKGNAAGDANDWHSTLASFNEGDIGPGHCDEDESSDVD